MQGSQISLQEKQIFLRNQILQGGLDPQSFMDYMGTVKNEGQNIKIENWTMQQLGQVVKDFKQQIQADTETLEQVKKSKIRQSQQIMAKIMGSIIKKQKVNYQRGLWDYEMLNEQECKSFARPFQFNNKIKPKIHVLNWQVRSHGGFFLGFGATKQLWLKIQTNFTQKPVQRTNNDFEWYRNVLVKIYAGAYIPPLAQLRAVQPQDKKGLSMRSKLIQNFLNSILQYEYLIQNPISKVFLSQPDHNKFTTFKNKERGFDYSKNVGRIQSLSGKFTLQISQRNQKFIKNASSFGKVAQQTYTQIDSQINKVLSDMETLSKHVLYISNSCGVLHQKYTKICGLNQIKDNSMETVMIYLNNMFSNIGKNIKEQMNLVKQFADDFIQSNIRSWEEFLLHDRKYQKQVQSYLYFKSQLIRKKQRFFNDVSKWQLGSQKQIQKVSRMNMSVMSKDQVFNIMFPKDNKAEEQHRVWVAYLNRVYEDSFKLFLKQQQNHLKQSFNTYIEQTTNLNIENHTAAKQFQQIIAVQS